MMMMISSYKAVVTVLWEYFTMALPDSDLEKSRDSILLLGMCGASEVTVIFCNFDFLNLIHSRPEIIVTCYNSQ